LKTQWRRRLSHAGLAAAVAGALTGIGTVATPALADGPEQIKNGTFDDGTANWWSTGNAPMSIVNGELCAPIPGNTANPWDAIIGQDNVPIVNGETYKVTLTAHSSIPLVGRVLLQNKVTFNASLDVNPDPAFDSTPRTYTWTFTGKEDNAEGQFALQLGAGGATQDFTFCLDNVSLTGGAVKEPYKPDTGPRVRVNQVGYLPNGPKNATLVTEATTPLPWELHNAAGAVVAKGRTKPAGTERTSGLNVHTITFSSYTKQGTGYTLVADGQTSHPFDLSAAPYEQLRTDALSVYYPWRSGIAIDNNIAPGYGRAAGHIGVAPNQGDLSVPCAPGTCNYSLDVSGGWYDAADHGKYVVNGGIAAYQMLNNFERTKVARTGQADKTADGTLRIPEHGNAVPDILDEARWEVQFLLKMQVPQGQPLAGMAHHKIHDENWTGLPLLPSNDPQPRYLQPPSTAATLNLAAVGAQAARIYAPYDPAFAAKALAEARTAYDAALAHPAIYAPSGGVGGGPYDDTDVSDEFYWAAAELYITTGEAKYSQAVQASPHHTDDAWLERGFDWGHVAQLGRLDLALLPNKLSDRNRVRQSVVQGAEKYLAIENSNPWALAYAPANNSFDWGSNNLVLNNLVVIASAFDLTNNAKYRDAVIQGMDYILGRNALNQSYVTGYGENASHNEHSRWFAHSLDPNLPQPPNGSLAGGPNSQTATWDPTAADKLPGCEARPQWCYLDNIQSYSTNEIAINWGSTLSWVSGFIADQDNGGAVPSTNACSVTYTNVNLPGGAYLTVVGVRNTSGKRLDGWSLNYAYLGGQKVAGAIGANASQTGANVKLANSGRLRNGDTAYVVLAGTNPVGLATPDPGLFTLNGSSCG
jgi:endoglucanase